MARFLVIKGPDEGKQFELADAVLTIGRDTSNKIRLHDTEVSRRHAELRLADGGYRVIDLGSANGTYVNNQRAQQATLQAGDHVTIGQTVLVYGAGRAEPTVLSGELAEKISLITRGDAELASAIISTIGESEGSRILAEPEKHSPWLRSALANLSVMYETSSAVSHILDIDELLGRILELIFRSIAADRGCVMLRHRETGALEPKALRARGEGESQRFAISRTIVDHVLREHMGILCSDAAKDERFNTGQSVIRLGIREVICVPMKGRHETLGVLYLDTKSNLREAATRKSGLGKFSQDHLALTVAIAHQAALAVEEQRYHQALLQAERLAAIGQTIAALSHHIKNILQGLRSGSDIIKMGLKDKNETLIQQGWRVAEKNQGKIYDLVMDMLSYSKERIPAVEPTDANAMVREVVELLESRARDKKVALETQLGDRLPRVPADPEGIHRALLNVVGNAIDAVEERPNPLVTISTQMADEHTLQIVVADNGPGITPQLQHEIFKPFVSTKGARGTGLGLPVSRKVLREHGGDLLLESQVGVGSKFTLQLPLRSPFSLDSNTIAIDPTQLPPEAN